MLGASLYITACTARNRLRVRLRRLREPRYLLGAIVGAAYMYFSVFARRGGGATAARRAARRGGDLPAPLVALSTAGPQLAGLGLLLLTVLCWILPGDSGLLTFSEAEIQFLFPAPVLRRQLLIHRMLRSQIGLLFASVVVAIMTPSAAGFTRLRVSIATWLTLVIAKVYFAGVSLSRSKLADGKTDARKIAWLPVVVLTTACAVVVTALVQAFAGAPATSAFDVVTRVGETVSHGAAQIVLWPFVTVARPLFADWPGPYLLSLVAAGGILLATAAWVLQSDRAFEDAAALAAERKALEPSRKRAGYRVRSRGWPLALTGRPETAFGWKAATQSLRLVDRRSLVRVVALLFSLTVLAVSLGRHNGLAGIVGFFATLATGMAILLAPQVLRIDMRQDLAHLEVLKTWPIPPGAVLRGEILWPGALITAFAWGFLSIAVLMSSVVFTQVGWSWRIATAASLAVLAPALVFAQLTIHNAAALLLPAWVPLGTQRPRGLDAMGQRLIMLGGVWLVLIVVMIPPAIAGGIVWFALQWAIGRAALVPGAIVCAVVVAIEVLLATEALGPAYEKIDILSVERHE